MGVTIAATRAALNTGTGTQDFTTTDLGGLTPKAALFILTRATTDGTAADNLGLCIGAATGATNRWAVCATGQDAQGTTVTDGAGKNRCVIMLDPALGTLEFEADFDSFITNGVRINITDAPPSAYLLTVVLFAGTDLTAFASSADLADTLDLETNITAPGFQPRVVIGACVDFRNINDAGSFGTTPKISFGAVHENGAGTVTQRSFLWRNTDAQLAVQLTSELSDVYGVFSMTATVLDWGGEFANFDASGFSVFSRLAGANGTDLGYLALAFNGVIDGKVVTITTPVAPGNQTQTGIGFTSQAALLGLTLAEAINTAYTDDNADAIGVGVITGTAEFCNAIVDDDTATDSDNHSLSDNTAVRVLKTTGADALTAAWSSWNSDGWVLNYSVVEAAGKVGWALAFGANPAAAGGNPYHAYAQQ